MSETSKMHFVPKTYLKHFAKERNKGKKREYLIHVLPKRSLDKYSISIRNTKDVCYELDLYKLNGSTEDERQYIEKMYRLLYEDRYNDLYKVLTDDAKDFLTHEQRYEIIAFVVSMFYRNAVWSNFYNKVMDETYAKAYHLAKQTGQDSFHFDDGNGNSKEYFFEGKPLEQFQKEMRIKDRPGVAVTLFKNIFELTRLRLANDVVSVIRLADGYEFVTSDNPVTFRSDEGGRPIPFDPTNTLSMPIDSKHLVELRSIGHEVDPLTFGFMRQPPLISLGTELINNHFQVAQADNLLLGSDKGLKRMLEQKDKYKDK